MAVTMYTTSAQLKAQTQICIARENIAILTEAQTLATLFQQLSGYTKHTLLVTSVDKVGEGLLGAVKQRLL